MGVRKRGTSVSFLRGYKMLEAIKLIEKIKALVKVKCEVILMTENNNLQILIEAEIKKERYRLVRLFAYQELLARRYDNDNDLSIKHMCNEFNDGYKYNIQTRGTEAEP